MNTAKIFANGQSQAVRLPKDCRFAGDEVYIKKIGEAVMLFPKERAWQIFLEGLDAFSPDFLQGGRPPEAPARRDTL